MHICIYQALSREGNVEGVYKSLLYLCCAVEWEMGIKISVYMNELVYISEIARRSR